MLLENDALKEAHVNPSDLFKLPKNTQPFTYRQTKRKTQWLDDTKASTPCLATKYPNLTTLIRQL